MNINKLEWGRCPHCHILINGWDYYPASMAMNNNGYYKMADCTSCGRPMYVKMSVEVKIECVKDEDENKEEV